MQHKINKLIELLKSLKSERQKNFAINLLSDIIDSINNQSKDIINLTERKFKIIPGEGKHELDKYITILCIYGFTQENISLLDNDILNFIFQHSNQLTKKPSCSDLRRIKTFYQMYQFENNIKPIDLKELKQFIIDTTKS